MRPASVLWACGLWLVGGTRREGIRIAAYVPATVWGALLQYGRVRGTSDGRVSRGIDSAMVARRARAARRERWEARIILRA